jgi:enoyl-CoA hydratase
MQYQNIKVELNENILVITLNRPDKMNALNIAMIREIGEVMDKVYADEDIKGVILTGSGDKAFAAGADIAEFAAFDKRESMEMSRSGHEVFNRIEHCPKPVIAAVNGFALGGGCELTLACHIRIASDTARFGQPEVNLGVIPGYGGTQRLAHLTGKGKALELIMTGDMVDAQTALQIGLANWVVPAGELMEASFKMMQKILKKGPLAITKTIQCVLAVYDNKKDGFEMEIDAFSSLFETEDFKEGTNAFVEKRKAVFKGK